MTQTRTGLAGRWWSCLWLWLRLWLRSALLLAAPLLAAAASGSPLAASAGAGQGAATVVALKEGPRDAHQEGHQAGRQRLDSGWAVLLDPQATLAPATIQSPQVQARFQPIKGSPSLGYIQGAAWLRLTLQVPEHAGGEKLLELQFPPIDEATLFWQAPQGLVASHPVGDRHPMAQRDVAHRNIVFRVVLQAGQPQTFYLRMQGRNTMNFSVVLWEPQAFEASALTEQLLWGVVLAVHLVLILSNLWFFQATRDAPYGLFATFILVSFLSVLFLEGLGYQYGLDTSPWLNDFLTVVSWMLAQPMSFLFMLSFTGLLGPGGRTWARALVGGLFAFAGSMILADQVVQWPLARPLFTAVHLCSAPLLFTVLAVQTAGGSRDARLMLWATLPLLVTVGLRLARNLGLLPPNAAFDHGYYVGLVVFLMLLNFAISRRYESFRQDAEAAKAKALETVRDFARELEARVEERTAEIAAAMRQVQGALALERRLRADQRTFFATVSHELRTPLAVIDATAQNLMLQRPPLDAATQTRLRKMQDATDRMASLLSRHLQGERLSDDVPGPRLQPCDLRALLEDAASSARLLSESHELKVSTDGLGQPFHCDPVLTGLALGNLADNAVKYTPAGTRILLRARREGDRATDGVLLEVIDDGPGIAPQERSRLFTGRFRGAGAAGVPGTGTGLLLARQMIQVQGGTLELQWPEEGGTVATIRLPAVDQPDSMASPKA